VCKQCPFYGTTAESGVGARTAWQTRQKQLIRWLTTLVRPVAIVAWTTEQGRELINACRRAGLLVPEQWPCWRPTTTTCCARPAIPSLSGIALTSERIGYEAAAVLDA